MKKLYKFRWNCGDVPRRQRAEVSEMSEIEDKEMSRQYTAKEIEAMNAEMREITRAIYEASHLLDLESKRKIRRDILNGHNTMQKVAKFVKNLMRKRVEK